MPPVYRVILVQYKADLDSEAKERIARGYLALAEQCKRDGQSYFTVGGGANISQEGLSGTTEQAFVVTFPSREDLDYFIRHDPVRAKYKEQIMPSFEELRVADFEENVFG
ncbi:hypothetical protein RHOSPDRAFT_35488 [Rhodotorula sp. JG-1b]|nr:hypothetical protein RHOSPDRAFT_35488 [Rhodotorula sp. JG-1b]